MRQVNFHGHELWVTDPETGKVYPVPAGGSADDGGTSDGDDNHDGDGDDAGDPDALGDPGKRALDAERQARKDAERELRQLKKEADGLREAQMDDHERALAKAAAEARAETAAKYGRQLAAAKAEAKAATLTRDPEAAVALLGDLTRFVSEEGDVDTDAMSEALTALVESKPYLKPETATATGGADQGRRPPADTPTLDDISDPEEVRKYVQSLR